MRKRFSAGSKRGQSMTEFALVIPILLIIVTGMVSLGITLHNFLMLTNAGNIGAQLLSASRGQTTDPCATASGAILNAAPTLTAANLTYTFVINGSSYTSTSCTAGAANMAQGATAQVTITYPCTLAIYGMSIPACTLQTTTAEAIQ